jgi:hypothetical protein
LLHSQLNADLPIGAFEIGTSLQHRGQTGHHSEACTKEHELVLVLVGDVHLLAMLRKRGLDLLVHGEVNGGAALLVFAQLMGTEIQQLRYRARQPVGACHMQQRAP